jgi:hypothetical protein
MTHGRQDRGPPFKGVGKKSRKHLPKLRKNASSYAKGRVGETRRRRWCCAPVLPWCIRSLLVLDVRARATARKHSCLEWHCDAGRQQPSNAHARARGCLFVLRRIFATSSARTEPLFLFPRVCMRTSSGTVAKSLPVTTQKKPSLPDPSPLRAP